jgi:hypothetical protein
MIVWGARANQRHTRHHRSSRVCEWSLHVRARCVCAGTTSLISLLSLFVCRCTPWHKHTHTHTHTQVTLKTRSCREYSGKQTKEQTNKRTNIYIHRHTGMRSGIYDCMRSDNESELANQLSAILRKANKQTCILVCLCMHVCMRSESESAAHSSPPQLSRVCEWSLHLHARACVLVLFR